MCEHARHEIVLCAPFVKRHVIDRVLACTAPNVAVAIISRWRPEEIAAGGSDTAVLESGSARGGSVLLHDRLHAKFYRGDDAVLLGSANLTGTALGWSTRPNLELLVGADRSL